MSFFDDIAAALLHALDRRFDRIDAAFADLKRTLKSIKQAEAIEMATLADIRTRVEDQQTVVASAVTLLQQLAQMLRDAIASNDPAAIQQIADMLDTERQSLADAVVANTPSAP